MNASPQSDRVLSIDALRGFDMFVIVGGDALARAICRLARRNADGNSVWSWIAGLEEQFEHVEWHGFHFYDLIFPLFLFLVGCVLPISLAKHQGPAAYGRVLRRTLALLACGAIYSGWLQFQFVSYENGRYVWDWSETRVPGVLQRIGLCYFFAALVVMTFQAVGRFVWVVLLLGGYFALLKFVAPYGGTAGDFTMEGSLVGWVDRKLLGWSKLYYGYGDNEGLLSTIPAIATTLLGALAGQWVTSSRSPMLKVFGLVAVGVGLVYAGWQWEALLGFPVNKILWTSSFVLVTAGWSAILLGAFYFVIDVVGFRWWAFPFVVIGSNAILIYMLRRVVDFKHAAEFFVGGVLRLMVDAGAKGELGPGQAVVFWSVVLLLEWLVLWVLYRHRLFLRV